MRILLSDKANDDLKILYRVFKRLGIETDIEISTLQSFEKMINGFYDYIITDFNDNSTDLYQLKNHIISNHLKTRIIILTTINYHKNVKNDVCLYLNKPLNIKHFLNIINEYNDSKIEIY